MGSGRGRALLRRALSALSLMTMVMMTAMPAAVGSSSPAAAGMPVPGNKAGIGANASVRKDALDRIVRDSDARTVAEAAQQWIADCAGLAGYEHWSGAEPIMTALGPGRHGWLALVTVNRKTVGHMIISAKAEGGFLLVGIGPGEPPPDLP